MDEIIDFAELRDFIETPVQSYSSGMTVRLGFAIASSLQPDVIILDEILAVGDESFRLKCFERVGKLLSGGVAGILVSHHMANIERTCSRCIVMSHGAALMNTPDIREAVEKYMSLQQKAYGKAEIHHHPQSPLRIRDIIVGEDGRTVDLQIAQTGQATTQVLVSYALQHKGVEVVRATTRTDEMEAIPVAGGKIRMRIPDEVLRLGKLRLDFSLWDLRERISLVAVRNVVLEASSAPGYRLSFETAGSGD
jgi:ABC-type multidrug transport system ATPase subunit